MGEIAPVRARHEAGVLAYFVARTDSAELAWDLAAETWASAELSLRRTRRAPEDSGAWLFAVARSALCESLGAGRVSDRARRRLGAPPEELTPEKEIWIRDAASHQRLAELVAGLAPAMREAVLAPVTARDAAAIGARLRPSTPARHEHPQRGRALRPRRLSLVR
jgi:DNA-directed RNA polymerase specialized sigma24 family protein